MLLRPAVAGAALPGMNITLFIDFLNEYQEFAAFHTVNKKSEPREPGAIGGYKTIGRIRQPMEDSRPFIPLNKPLGTAADGQ